MPRHRSRAEEDGLPDRSSNTNNERRGSDQRRHRPSKHGSHRKQSRTSGYHFPPRHGSSPYIHKDQNSNDVLNQYYSGEPLRNSNQHQYDRRSDYSGDEGSGLSNDGSESFDEHGPYQTTVVAEVDRPNHATYGPAPAHVTFVPRIDSRESYRPVDLDSTLSEKPSTVAGDAVVKEGQGLWSRAARVAPTGHTPKLETLLKLELSRKADQYRSRPFKYTTATYSDTTFAHLLLKEYHSLKTDHVGLVQKITAYKRIAFIHFVQYRAERHSDYAYGRWTIRKRVPVIDHKDEKFRSFFMYQMASKVRKRSKVFNTSEGVPPAAAPTYNWVDRLDELVVPGAVIDIQVEETFDTPKVYFGFLLAILLSLGAALAYGFTMERDFSTGFAIASWLITVYAFSGAIVAAGEFFGLEKPTATLTPVDNLKIGRERRETPRYP